MEAPVSPVVGFKTVAPPLDGTIERPAALSSLRRPTAQAKWLLGPSGSGKSTLVASALTASGKPYVWYRLDARDNDPAFLYTGLAAAIEQQVPTASDLPLFADDDRENEAGFAERIISLAWARPLTWRGILSDATRESKAMLHVQFNPLPGQGKRLYCPCRRKFRST